MKFLQLFSLISSGSWFDILKKDRFCFRICTVPITISLCTLLENCTQIGPGNFIWIFLSPILYRAAICRLSTSASPISSSVINAAFSALARASVLEPSTPLFFYSVDNNVVLHWARFQIKNLMFLCLDFEFKFDYIIFQHADLSSHFILWCFKFCHGIDRVVCLFRNLF